jgi:hypothetical protein
MKFPFRKRRRKQLNVEYFTGRWQELQKHCANRKTWPLAITEADKLLEEALKKRGYKGKTTGARLVAAQHDLSANSTIWLGHKLCNKLTQEDVDIRKLKKKDMMDALAGFRQALRDLGALAS